MTVAKALDKKWLAKVLEPPTPQGSAGDHAHRAPQRERDEVRGNIPPELVALFERVKRGVKASPRMSRTQAFLHYTEENQEEVLEAISDTTEEMVRQLEEEHRRRSTPRVVLSAAHNPATPRSSLPRCRSRVERQGSPILDPELLVQRVELAVACRVVGPEALESAELRRVKRSQVNVQVFVPEKESQRFGREIR